MNLKNTLLSAGAAVVALGFVAEASAQSTLEAVVERGTLNCGVSTGLAGFSIPDSDGNWTGLDVDVCRALAAVVLDDPDAINFVATTAVQRFPALQSGEVDLLSRNTTHTLSRDTSLGFNFAPITFYDGQGFMVPKELGVTSALELDGASVCVQPGTTTELNLADYFRANGMEFEPVVIEELSELNAAYFSGRCDVYTTDVSGLAGNRTQAPNPDDHVILPEVISKEPLAPAVRHGDDQWLDIVAWTVWALLEAEEKGVTQANIDELIANEGNGDPVLQRLLGQSGELGQLLGVSDDFAVRAVKAVGNYGEIFERNVGVDTPVGLPRGVNALWTQGGLMYSPPIR